MLDTREVKRMGISASSGNKALRDIVKISQAEKQKYYLITRTCRAVDNGKWHTVKELHNHIIRSPKSIYGTIKLLRSKDFLYVEKLAKGDREYVLTYYKKNREERLKITENSYQNCRSLMQKLSHRESRL